MSKRSSSDTSPNAERRTGGDSGVSMIALIASVAILLIGMGLAAPTWTYLTQRENEEELVFRGFQIVKGIREWQRRNGGALPTSLKLMKEQKVLRAEYKDPITERRKGGGRWRFVSPAQPVPECMPLNQVQVADNPPRVEREPQHVAMVRFDRPEVARAALFSSLIGGLRGGALLAQASSPPPDDPPEPPGGFSGVMSRSDTESYGVFNTKNNYNKWCFSLDTIPENILSLTQLRYVMMTFPKEKKPKFTGKGKRPPDRKGRREPVAGQETFDPFTEPDPAAPQP